MPAWLMSVPHMAAHITLTSASPRHAVDPTSVLGTTNDYYRNKYSHVKPIHTLFICVRRESSPDELTPNPEMEPGVGRQLEVVTILQATGFCGLCVGYARAMQYPFGDDLARPTLPRVVCLRTDQAIGRASSAAELPGETGRNGARCAVISPPAGAGVLAMSVGG